MDQRSVEYEVCSTRLHMTSAGNRTQKPSDLESNALSTLSYVPMVLNTYPANPFAPLNQFGSVFVLAWLKNLKADGLVYQCTCL